jgi:hypothetical protein
MLQTQEKGLNQKRLASAGRKRGTDSRARTDQVHYRIATRTANIGSMT